MREFDVAIAGAGLAGSIIASALGRKGHSVAIVDPNDVYPDEFRCEKVNFDQIESLAKSGLGDAVLAAATHDKTAWVSRLGLLIEKRPSDQLGIDYGRLVNTLRAEMPPDVAVLRGKVTAISNGDELQRVTLSTGETITARLLVIASGLSNSLRQSLGIERDDISRCHSVTFGFDVEPVGRDAFPFRALTHYSEDPQSGMAFLTLFPIGTRMRANLFVYRDLDDPWLRAFRAAPEETMNAAMPRLERLTGPYRVSSPIKVRPIDLYKTLGYRQPGVVLVGDAFSTACPAAGTGARKAMVDAERLCHGYVSQWLATPGMGVEKISQFYDDGIKVGSDRKSLALAMRIKAMSIDTSAAWWLRRWASVGVGLTRWGVHSAREARGRFVTAARSAHVEPGDPPAVLGGASEAGSPKPVQ
jgi:2-polyprenyl-6-methoxyphenol hydroxylase-like FAD-dependent oxidoreductase